MGIPLSSLALAVGKGVGGYRRGQDEGDLTRRATEQAQMEFALRLAPELRRRNEEGALNSFLGSQPEGVDLAGRGLNPTAALGIYTQRLQARRAATPNPLQANSLRRQAAADLKNRAQDEADYIARTNDQPSALGIFAALRAKRDYKPLDDATLRGVAASAVGPKRPNANTDFSDTIRRAAEGLGITPTPRP